MGGLIIFIRERTICRPVRSYGMIARTSSWAAALWTASVLVAQAPPEPKYGYEVASIKKAVPGPGVRIGPGPQGGMRTQNTNLMTLITFAYDVREYQVLEAPGWAKGHGFDVSFTPDKPEALPGPGSGILEMETMMNRQRQRLQAILRDRFGLVLRVETRLMPVYGLVEAKGGNKLTAASGAGKGPGMQTNAEKGVLTGTGANMRMLSNILSNLLKRPVVNETTLDGPYDLKLEWKPDTLATGPKQDAVELEGASVFTAITEQPGLRLEAKKGPVTVYVVQKADRPEDN